MDGLDHPPSKKQLSQMVDNMEEWQVKLVLSFVRTLFGPEPMPAEEQAKI